MKIIQLMSVVTVAGILAGCALTPEQKAERAAKRLKAEQALQVSLAKQCDVATAELMQAKFNPPLEPLSAKQQAEFDKQYVEKVNASVFQACYKLAWQNYQAQQELDRLQRYYDDDFRFFGFRRFCHLCW
ncbi:hypothetical protein E4T80_02350 [Muribacter muris]|uniref:Lipoprotein n=1 Tax=Muribacter muris TaxID=67855 RepID=A0A4Y9K8K4_9PAST|nr:hypothetical protein [Muribacter muris]MBF0784320.1 hypothetical protein [Muribacter muris]MBF0826943.1 hypothetical protein [Muribacter muris]TFV13057.1 hypothetical protein E4T80_02350 [Muribacter muris]